MVTQAVGGSGGTQPPVEEKYADYADKKSPSLEQAPVLHTPEVIEKEDEDVLEIIRCAKNAITATATSLVTTNYLWPWTYWIACGVASPIYYLAPPLLATGATAAGVVYFNGRYHARLEGKSSKEIDTTAKNKVWSCFEKCVLWSGFRLKKLVLGSQKAATEVDPSLISPAIKGTLVLLKNETLGTLKEAYLFLKGGQDENLTAIRNGFLSGWFAKEAISLFTGGIYPTIAEVTASAVVGYTSGVFAQKKP